MQCYSDFPLLFICLYWNFKLDYYHPVLYWGAIILSSICGTIWSDGLHDNLGMELWIELICFFTFMSLFFYRWLRSEGTLDIHSINSFQREWYYWWAVIWTFALGTAVGDCTANHWAIGLGQILGFFIGITSIIVFAWVFGRYTGYIKQGDKYEIFLFWCAYIMTRPMGASTGDLLGLPKNQGGLGLGTEVRPTRNREKTRKW